MDCSLPGSSIHGIFQARVLEWGAIAFSVSHTYTNSWSPFTCQPHSSYTSLSFTEFTLPMYSVTLSQESAENLHVDIQGPFAYLFFSFFLTTLTHKFQTYYDPQTHFCLLNKIFNFVELYLHPFQPYMYSQVKRKSKPRGHFICFSSHTAPRPCCQLYSVKTTVLIFCLVLCLSSVHSSHSVESDSLQPHALQHARPPCPSPTPRVYSNSRPLSWWCHP